MSFSINRTFTVTRTTDSGIPLSPASEDIEVMLLDSSKAACTSSWSIGADFCNN